MDSAARQARRVESALDELVNEVLAILAAVIE